jgi:hypothetical protein
LESHSPIANNKEHQKQNVGLTRDVDGNRTARFAHDDVGKARENVFGEDFREERHKHTAAEPVPVRGRGRSTGGQTAVLCLLCCA